MFYWGMLKSFSTGEDEQIFQGNVIVLIGML